MWGRHSRVGRTYRGEVGMQGKMCACEVIPDWKTGRRDAAR